MEQKSVNIGNQFDAICSSIRFSGLIAAILFLVGGIVFIAIGALVYFKKVKGQERKPVWIAAAVISLGLGVILFLGGLGGLIAYFTTPSTC